MEEEKKKKRTRPTMSQYLEVQEELVSAEKKVTEWIERCQKQEDELNAFRKSNTLLEEELRRVRNANNSLLETVDQMQKELRFMKSRGLIARLFNR